MISEIWLVGLGSGMIWRWWDMADVPITSQFIHFLLLIREQIEIGLGLGPRPLKLSHFHPKSISKPKPRTPATAPLPCQIEIQLENGGWRLSPSYSLGCRVEWKYFNERRASKIDEMRRERVRKLKGKLHFRRLLLRRRRSSSSFSCGASQVEKWIVMYISLDLIIIFIAF